MSLEAINDPQLTLPKIAQMGMHDTGTTRSEHYTVPGSRVQSLSEVTFCCIYFALIQFCQS